MVLCGGVSWSERRDVGPSAAEERRVLGRLGRKGNGVADWAKKRGKGRPGWFALGLGKLLRLFYSKPTQNYKHSNNKNNAPA